ncbi:MAG: NERD domain-containing protein [Acidobacteriota bacterium]
MATMIPREVEEFKTDGESRFYRFLESFAKPDRKYTIWYLPDIKGREPDFVLFCEEVGIVIFEVKDWAINQIVEANPHQFTLRMGRDKKSLKNPMVQAKEYYETLMDRIKADGRLVNKSSSYYGKPKFPIECGVVFPNISRSEFHQLGLDQVINPSKIFFRDDLHLESTICNDPSGECFGSTVIEMFPPRFRFKISWDEYTHLKQLLFPVVRVDHSHRDACSYVNPAERTFILDDWQEAIARKYSSGCHIVKGPSGSGKTLTLVAKAAFLKHYNQEIGSVLFLCLNPALVNQIKRMLFKKGVGLGAGEVEVCHFHELCSEAIGEKVEFGLNDPEYYRLIMQEALSAIRRKGKKFDAILIDDGHDFTNDMLQTVHALLENVERPNLTIAVDTDLDQHNAAWKFFKPLMRTTVEEIPSMYRNSEEIRHLILGFSGRKDLGRMSSTYCEVHGPQPELKALESRDDVMRYVVDSIGRMEKQGDYPLSEIAVLYAGKPGQGNDQEASRLVSMLEARGIMAQWLSEDYRTRRSHDITAQRVTVAAVEDARGLDYACVFLLDIDRLEDGARASVHAGLTRARHRLCIPYVEENRLVSDLLAIS